MMNKKTKILYTKLIILITCFIIILRLFTLILAKYESETSADAQIDIAFYLFKEDYQTMTLSLGSILPQNNVYVYNFKIGNQNETETAEIDLTYDLTIRTTTNLPLTYNLYMNQSYTDSDAQDIAKTNEIIQDDDETYFRVITTETEELKFKEPKTNMYQLVVHFPENYNTENYQDIIEAIEITTESRQYTP